MTNPDIEKKTEEFRKHFHFLFDHGYAVHEGEEGEDLVGYLSQSLQEMYEMGHKQGLLDVANIKF